MKNIFIFFILILLNSCAAFLAVTPNKPPALEQVGLGSSRGEIELIFGNAEKTMILAQGHRIDFYRFKNGDAPNLVRGAIHGSMSAATSGTWEVIGIPYEESMRRDKLLAVTYNELDIAINLNEIEPPIGSFERK